jgi:hypothetical protein
MELQGNQIRYAESVKQQCMFSITMDSMSAALVTMRICNGKKLHMHDEQPKVAMPEQCPANEYRAPVNATY